MQVLSGVCNNSNINHKTRWWNDTFVYSESIKNKHTHSILCLPFSIKINWLEKKIIYSFFLIINVLNYNLFLLYILIILLTLNLNKKKIKFVTEIKPNIYKDIRWLYMYKVLLFTNLPLSPLLPPKKKLYFECKLFMNSNAF